MSHVPAKVMAVLKANAYGHGVDGVAPYIAPYADYIGVAIVEEGIHLRELGIDKPILVMGGTFPEQVSAFAQYDLTSRLHRLNCWMPRASRTSCKEKNQNSFKN